MATSILTNVKKALGVEEGDTAFDADILMFTNSVLATLNQIGIGPEEGFRVEDAEATWDDLIGSDPRGNNVQTYVYLKVRLLFDPPGTSFAIKALEDQARELEVRMYIRAEAEQWS